MLTPPSFACSISHFRRTAEGHLLSLRKRIARLEKELTSQVDQQTTTALWREIATHRDNLQGAEIMLNHLCECARAGSMNEAAGSKPESLNKEPPPTIAPQPFSGVKLNSPLARIIDVCTSKRVMNPEEAQTCLRRVNRADLLRYELLGCQPFLDRKPLQARSCAEALAAVAPDQQVRAAFQLCAIARCLLPDLSRWPLDLLQEYLPDVVLDLATASTISDSKVRGLACNPQIAAATWRDLIGMRLDAQALPKGYGEITIDRMWQSLSEAVDRENARFHVVDIPLARHLHNAVMRMLESRDNNERYRAGIMRERLGLEGPARTLAAIGQRHQVKRQAIDQTLDKVWATWAIDEVWASYAHSELRRRFELGGGIIPLKDLAVDEWWHGPLLDPNILATFVKGLGIKPVHVLIDTSGEQGGAYLVATKGQELNGVRHHISDYRRNQTKPIPITALADILVEKMSGLTSQAMTNLIPALVPEAVDGPFLLPQSSRAFRQAIMDIVASAPAPLHWESIADILQTKGLLHGERDRQRVHSTLSSDKHFLLLGFGTFGIEKHYNWDDDTIIAVAEACHAIMSSAPHRQWSCQELADRLDQGILEDENQVTPYRIDIALTRCPGFRRLGRFIVVLEESNTPSERIMLLDLVKDILNTAAKPLSRSEILAQIRQTRGCNDGALCAILALPQFERVSEGIYQLAVTVPESATR